MTSFVQAALGADGGGPVNTFSASGNPITAGDWIVGIIQWYEQFGNIGEIASISDGVNTYPVVDYQYDAAQSENVATFAGPATVGGQSTVTATFAAAATYQYARICWQEVQGVGSINAHTVQLQTSAGSSLSSGNVTTTAASYIYGASVCTGAGGVTFSAGSGFALENSSGAGNNCPQADEYEIQSIAGMAAATFSGSNTSTDYITAIIALSPPTITVTVDATMIGETKGSDITGVGSYTSW